ncbi:hypothetical protein AB3R30_25195 [Leptolyngbyaceae cyanobacterium UHCC 1019]
MSYAIVGVNFAESEVQQNLRDLQSGATGVGVFEWLLEEPNFLSISCRYVDLNFYPELHFSKGWGDTNYVPTEADIKALFHYRAALELAFSWDSRANTHLLPCTEAWIENSFTEVLSRLKTNWTP